MKKIFSEMARYTGADRWRYAGFVLLNVAMATVGTYFIIESQPPLRGESLQSFVLPMGVISALVFTLLYPLLRRLTPGIPRFLALYGAFIIALVALTLYSGVLSLSRMPPGEFIAEMGRLLILVIAFGHVLGFVPLLGIAAINRIFSGLFFPRLHPAR